MARYYPISPQFWTDPTTRSWDDATRLFAFYLLTCPHRNLEGLYRLPPAYVQADLGWQADAVGDAMATLLRDGFIEYDAEAEVVFVCNALKYQAPKSERQIKGAINSLLEVPETHLRESLAEVAATHAPDFAKALDTHSEGTR